MAIEFYLDLFCTFLLHVYEQVSCCGDKNPNIEDETTRKEYGSKWKTRILLIRVVFGFIFNVSGFITVCILNKETYIEDRYAQGLFISIITFTGTSYILIELGVWFVRKVSSNLICMIFYRVHEIQFDVLMFFYSLVLSDWEMTDFTIATTVLACSDIVMNIIILIRNCYDLDADIRRYVLYAVLFGFLFPPLLTIFLCCYLSAIDIVSKVLAELMQECMDDCCDDVFEKVVYGSSTGNSTEIDAISRQ